MRPLNRILCSIPLVRRPFYQRDVAVAERDRLIAERERLLAERDALAAERDLALAERDAGWNLAETSVRDPDWVILTSWPRTEPAWVSYTVGTGRAAAIRKCREQEELAAARGFTTLSDREVDRAYMLAFAYILASCAEGKDSISILDFGGSLGHYSIVARQAVPDKTVAYTVRELPEICEVGKTARPNVIFVSEDQALAPSYDLVFASGALQCVRDWAEQLADLAERAAPWLFLSRVPALSDTPTAIARQKVPQGYVVTWLWNEAELVAKAESCGLGLERIFCFQETFVPILGAAELPKIRGYLFRRS